MIKKNLLPFAKREWKKYKNSITNISKDSHGKPLVTSKIQIYHFDEKIIPTIFDSKKIIPCSADGIVPMAKKIIVIEFKQGFKDKITIANYDPQKAMCSEGTPPIPCPEYWKLFCSIREKEKKELINAIKLKAIETYITLEKHIFPNCPSGKNIEVDYFVVIDGDDVDGQENILENLAGKTKGNNIFAKIRESLIRLQTTPSKNYYYDKIEVLSGSEFLEKIKDYK